MSLTRQQLRELVESNTARTDLTTQINTYLNQGVEWALSRHSFYAQIRKEADVVAVVGEDHLDLPSDLRKLLYVRRVNSSDGNNAVIQTVSKRRQDFIEPDVDDNTNSRPYVGYVQDTEYKVFPKHSSADTYRFTYLHLPSFSSDSDTISLLNVDEFLENYATLRVAQSRGIRQLAADYSGMMLQAFRNMVAADVQNFAEYLKIYRQRDEYYLRTDYQNDPMVLRDPSHGFWGA